jgi:phosphinothricin acetyltransferase
VAPSVRAGTAADLPALTDIYNHYVVHSHATFDLTPFSVDARREWFGHYAQTGPYRLLVAVEGPAVLGYATSGRFRDKQPYSRPVVTTIDLAAYSGGRGAASLLYAELFAALAGEDVHRAYAGVALPNDASLALHRAFGFTDVGTFREVGRKFDRWWDVLWLERAVGGPGVSD